MPTTVNGVGTHYYGKRDRSTRTAACRSCGRVGELQSYDTRLWFVILFIPIIPLGRKRIIDECPSCRRHFVASAAAYEEARQLQVSAAQDQFRRDPSPGAALQVHGTLLGFHEPEQATEFRRTVLARFPADAELRATMAAQLEQAGGAPEAAELYDDAYRLQPDLPEARTAIAWRKMAAGELEEAHRLLDFLEVPGAGQHYPLGPIDALSTYYQKEGRHEEALAIAEHVLRELPEVGQQHKYRAFVGRSEKALGRTESILPPRQHSLREVIRGDGHVYSSRLRLSILGTVGILLLSAGLAINNEYIRRHRTIHVVNGIGVPVQVRVDDAPPQTVGDFGQIAVAEGKHRIQVGGPVDETHDVTIEAGYLDRWFSKPAWVLVPGSEAMLVEHTVHYARNPTPSQHRLIFGHPFVSLSHVDYAFEDPPQSIQVKGNAEVVKKVIERFAGSNVQGFQAATEIDRLGALDFAERRLRRQPGDPALFKAYYTELKPAEHGRGELFLATELDRRPVDVPWHRRYQLLAELNGHFSGLAARYDGYLKTAPQDAALLYLRGRIEADRSAQEKLYRRAIEADPKLPWPWDGLAFQAAAAARWRDCLLDVEKARSLKIDEDVVEDSLMTARIATGTRDLTTELRGRLTANVLEFDSVRRLMEAVAASGSAADVEHEVNAWLNRVPADVRGLIADPVRSMVFYETGKLAEAEKLCQTPQARGSIWRLHCLLGLKRTRDAVADPGLGNELDDPWEMLAVSLAWSLEGHANEAADWLRRGVARLETMGPNARRAATFLNAKKPPPPEQIAEIMVTSRRQALACALVAGRFPADRKAYLAAAARYNLRRVPPYQLVRQAIEAETATTESPSTTRR